MELGSSHSPRMISVPPIPLSLCILGGPTGPHVHGQAMAFGVDRVQVGKNVHHG